MKKNNLLLKRKPGRIFRTWIFIFLILFLQAFVLTSEAQNYQQTFTKRSRDAYAYSDTVQSWLDWNILFHKNANDKVKNNYIKKLETYINQQIAIYNSSSGKQFKVDYHVVYCPCDSLLTNLNATPAIGSSGNTIPPPPPGTGGSGDTVSLNMTMYPDTLIQDGKYVYNIIEKKVPLTIVNVDKKKILAVMDTGLDPRLFPTGFNKLLWNDPKSKITLRNFQFYHNNRPLDYMLDDDAHLHGTAVISVALQEFERAPGNPNNPKPMIMVLKVLDERGHGNTFSVSCGLSYAIQKKATLVNASLGYYSHGIPDSILLHYVRLCNDAKLPSIPILAAAGNTPGKHDASFLCNPAPKSNELSNTNTFDPASFSKQLPNVISVTTLQNDSTACFFQNYSNDYVNVGVANGSGASCCKFAVPFLPFGYEGSSFATPFISGKMMACLMEGRTLQNCREQWSTTTPVGTATVTKDGKFVPNP
jgi:Subtilase family